MSRPPPGFAFGFIASFGSKGPLNAGMILLEITVTALADDGYIQLKYANYPMRSGCFRRHIPGSSNVSPCKLHTSPIFKGGAVGFAEGIVSIYPPPRNITCLAGNPYKPLFATVTVSGVG